MSRASIGLLAGALWAGCLSPGPWWLAAVAAAGLPLTAVACRRRPRAALAAGAALLVLAGAGLAGARVAIRDGAPLAQLAAQRATVTVQSTAVSDAREHEYGSWLLVRVTAVDDTTMRARAFLRVDEETTIPELGERFLLRATVHPLEADGFHGWLRSLGAAASLQPRGAVDIVGEAAAPLRWTTAVRDRTRAAFVRALAPDEAALLGGLVTGDRRGQDPAFGDAFRRSGLTHLVVVSGRHVGLLLAGVVGLAGACRAGFRGRRWIGLVALAWFVVLVRWQPSVLRAALMATLILAAALLGRGHDAPHVLAVAVVVLLLGDPLLAVQVGFALSVLATAGVLLLAPPLAERLRGPRSLRLLAAATIGAQLAVAPVLLRFDGGLATGALPANLVAGPAAALAQAIGLVGAFCAQVSIGFGAAVALAARPALWVVLWAARTFADLPTLDVVTLVSPTVLAIAAALALWRRRPRLAASGLAAVVVIAAIGWLRPPAPVDALRIVMLDVGQGDALLVEAPYRDAAARMLVDGGPDPAYVRRALRGRGIRRLDAVVLSHPHDDHSGGLPQVLRGLAVGAFLVGPHPPASTDDHASSAREAYEVASGRNIPVRPVTAGQRFRLGDATVHVLGPSAEAHAAESANDRSVVLRVDGAFGRILLTGDAEVAEQSFLLRRPQELRATVLKVPHHGGATNAPGFIDAVDPAVALVSAGVDNDYGHPSTTTLDDLVGATVWRTDEHGTVMVTLSAAGPVSESDRVARHYTPADGAPARLPVHRPGGAAAAARRGAAARRIARQWRTRHRRRARQRAARARAAGSAHQLPVRHAAGAADPRRRRAVRRSVRGPPNRA